MNRRHFVKEEHQMASIFHGLATLFNSVTAPKLSELKVSVPKDLHFYEHRPATTKAYRERRRTKNRIAAKSRAANRR